MGDSDCGNVHSSDCHCSLCRVRKPKRKKEYCIECSKEVEACKNDAEDNDWMRDFEAMKEHPGTFTAMMREFLLQCPKPTPGRGHKRNFFDTSMLPTRLMKQPRDSAPRSSGEVSP